MMSVVERIRRNDPRVTSVVIDLSSRFSDAEITEALEQNPHVVCINVDLKSAVLRNWPRLLHHLETRNNLHSVHFAFWESTHPTTAANVLQAVQRNTNVRDIVFYGVGVTVGQLVSFLNNAASHITDLALVGNSVIKDTDDNIDGPSLLAASVQRIINLQSLKLYALPVEYSIPILNSLKRKTSLHTLGLDCPTGNAAFWTSFRNLMRTTLTIRKFEFEYPIPARFKEPFLEIVKSNFSLRVVRPRDQAEFGNIFTAAEQRRLAFYADRNARMDLWTERPSTVPQNLRPQLLLLAATTSQTHPSVLYRSLLAIRDELGTAKDTQKSKRAANCEPS